MHQVFWEMATYQTINQSVEPLALAVIDCHAFFQTQEADIFF